jgi:aminoglycoside 6'-N-acetyltransferase I
MTFPQDERSQLPGWPGYRTRPGRSGLDWIDTQIEAAHVQGVLLRQFLTFKFQSRNPVVLIILAFYGLNFLAELSFVVRQAIATPLGYYELTPWTVILLTLGIRGLIGVFALVNVGINLTSLMKPLFTIIDLEPDDTQAIEQAAALLVEGFREHWPEAWPDLDSALEEAREMLAEDRICRIAVDNDGNVVGWIGGIPEYDGHVWELHPLVVKPDEQQQGIGRALVQDFEAQVRQRGGLTITLGTDDEDNMTTLSNVDLYQDTWEKIAGIRNFKGHPYEFYQKLGYTITGVVPDANGLGKPDILMAKRVYK